MQKSLSFSKGITNTPSDLLSDDTELANLRGFIFRNGEIQPIRQARKFAQIPYKLIYVHKGADYSNAISYDGDNLYWGALDVDKGTIGQNDDKFPVGKVSDITSVGNTLVVATDKGIHYILFNERKYTDLGTELPKPEFRFWLESKSLAKPINKSDYISFQDYMKTDTCQAFYTSDNKLCQIEYVDPGRNDSSGVVKGTKTITSGTPDTSKTLTYRGYCAKQSKTAEINTACNALAALHLAEVKKENLFAFPFFVRFALRLYDGSYTRISAPVLCLPSIHTNMGLKPIGVTNNPSASTQPVGYFLPEISQASLWFKSSLNNADKWSDIVKDVVIFASDEEMQFAIDGDWKFYQPHELMETYIYDRLVEGAYSSFGKWSYDILHSSSFGSQTDGLLTSVLMPAKIKTEEQIIAALSKKGVFYKLLEFPFLSINNYNDDTEATKLINDDVVTNLTVQEQLGVDDYMGWTTISASKLYSYNNRINALGIKRKPYSGFNHSVAIKPSASYSLSYYVRLVKTTGDVWIKGTVFYSNTSALLSWFFYPDPNAKEVLFYDESTKKGISINLRSHPRLNGAYFMQKLPEASFRLKNISKPVVNDDFYEFLDSQIFTSVVNNPFVFQASGDNTVGTGTILGIAANTEPISQGQFGQYPLLVFTTEGIYGMSVNSEGLYSASYPISREICNNPESITPTGNVVYFTSDKGLMAVSGGSVRCVSPQLSGSNTTFSAVPVSFLTFVRNAFLAYDYRNSLLYIYNADQYYAYVYNLLDGTFATTSIRSNSTKRAVSNYPDTLLQDDKNNVYSFSKIPEVQDDTRTYEGVFITRPLKLGSSLQLKTIHQILHLFDTANGKIALRIYGSNDCRKWCELHSLHGKPWKYYTLSYKLSNMLATDTFAGTVVDFQPLFTKKMR